MRHHIDARVLTGLRLLISYLTALLWSVGILLLLAEARSSATVIITGAVIAHVGLLRLAEAGVPSAGPWVLHHDAQQSMPG